MTMKTPEEEFSNNVWETLQRIKKNFLGTPDGQPIDFRLSTVAGSGVVSAQEEAQVIRKLVEWGALRYASIDSNHVNWGHAGCRIRIFLQQPQFDEQYKKYQQQNTHKVHNLDAEKLVPFPQGVVTYGQIQKLERLYASFFNLPERGFFLGIADYIKYVVETESLDKEAQKIKEQKGQDESKITALEEKLKKDYEKVADDIFRIINKHNLSFPEVEGAIRQYKGIRDRTIQSNETIQEALHGGLAGMVGALFAKGYQELVKEYVETSSEGKRILHYRISPHYLEYKKELRKFRELRKRSIWGAWNELVLVYLAVHKPDEQMDELKGVGDFLRQMDFAAIVREMNKIINGEQGQRIVFQVEEYKIAASRVHNFLVGDGPKELEIVKRAREEAFDKIAQIRVPTVEFPSRLLTDLPGLAEVAKLMVFDPQKISGMQSIGKTILEASKKWQEDLVNSAAHLTEPREFDFNIPAPDNYELKLQARGVALQEEILEELRQRKGNMDILNQDISNTPDKQKRKSELQFIRERCELEGMEFKLLKELFDFQLHTHDYLKQKTGSKALSQLKRSLLKKIKKEGFEIDSQRGDSVRKPTYQLVRLIDSSRD